MFGGIHPPDCQQATEVATRELDQRNHLRDDRRESDFPSPTGCLTGWDAKDPHAPAGVFDDGEDLDGGAVEQGDGEEVGREDRLP